MSLDDKHESSLTRNYVSRLVEKNTAGTGTKIVQYRDGSDDFFDPSSEQGLNLSTESDGRRFIRYPE